MNKIKYTLQFKEALNLCKQNKLFLGLGNPNAKILIIGKEAAIDKEKNPGHYEMEVENNVKDWEHNCDNNKQLDEVLSWFAETTEQKYNPLYPYKGQKNTLLRKKKVDGQIVNNKGTSKTWYNYQKIADKLVNNNSKNNEVNFHENMFISELNQESAKYSHLVAKEKRGQSIIKRKPLFETTYFREFPITIVAVGHYVRDFNVNLEELFGVVYSPELSAVHSKGLNNEFINIHFDLIEKPTRLLIHTNQLSMVSNELVDKVGDVCSVFMKEKI